ncbi:GntR family transcriptional regulator [Paraburkholderia nemoris]
MRQTPVLRRSAPSLDSPARRPTEDEATDTLRHMILNGQLGPGCRVTEHALADEIGMTRGAARSALNHLSREGLIIKVPYSGWLVMPLTASDAWELYTLRANLEMLAASLAAQHLDSRRAAELQMSFEQLVAACRKQNRALVAEADFQLHKTIVTISGHQRLLEQYRLVQQQIRVYISSSDAITPTFQTFIDHHQPIVEAILSRDSESAARLSSEHNLSEGRKLHKALLKVEAARATSLDENVDAPG